MLLFNELKKSNLKKIALIEGEKQFLYEDLFSRIKNCADLVASQSFSKHGRVGLKPMTPTGLLISYYGCQLAGRTPVPVPFSDEERIQGAIAQAEIDYFLDDPTSLSLPECKTEHDSWEKGTSSNPEALVLFTSGTTSNKLKGVRLSHNGISSSCNYMNELMGFDDNICELVFASIDHAYGFGRCHCVLKAGGTVVLPKNLKSLMRVSDLVEKHKCNALSTPPSILSSILRRAPKKIDLLSKRVRFIQTGAMRFDNSFRMNLVEKLPNTRIFLHYGLSEAMRVTLFELNSNIDKIDTEGPPSKNVSIAIFDKDLKMQDNKKEGLIGIKGDNLCLGYLDEEHWKKNIKDGYFITSDRGLLDNDGFLTFKGRNDDVINANGVLVHPDEIEKKILKVWPHLVFSVVGIDDPQKTRDSIVVLCVEGSSDLSLTDLNRNFSDIDANLIPQFIVSVDELPLTRTGKVNRNQLRKLAYDKVSKTVQK